MILNEDANFAVADDGGGDYDHDDGSSVHDSG